MIFQRRWNGVRWNPRILLSLEADRIIDLQLLVELVCITLLSNIKHIHLFSESVVKIIIHWEMSESSPGNRFSWLMCPKYSGTNKFSNRDLELFCLLPLSWPLGGSYTNPLLLCRNASGFPFTSLATRFTFYLDQKVSEIGN